MKIIYLHQFFVTPEMSGGTRSYEMARRLVADGHEVHMITSDRVGGARREEIIDGIRVTWIPVEYSNSMSFARRIWSFIMFAVFATIVGVRSNPSLVFATSTPLTIVIPALVIRWVRRVPMVFEVRDLWPEMPIAIGAISNPVLIRLARWMEKLAYFQSSQVIALSPGMKNGVLAAGYPESKVVVIPNGSDIDAFRIDAQVGQDWLQRQPWYRGGPVILYAGTFGLINRVDYLVEVAHYVRQVDPKPTMLLVGEGKERPRIEQRAQELGLLGVQVVIMDRVQKKDIPVLYSAATVATSTVGDIPHIENNSANKFFDSLAAGRPVFINHSGWLANLIDEWDCGLVLSQDYEEAARQVLEFVAYESTVNHASAQARALAFAQFNRDTLYGQFRDTLLLAEKAS